MSPLKTIFTYECEILVGLLDANVKMASWNYLPALLKINETQTKLETWARIFHSKETRRLGLFKTPQPPQLYQWLMKFKCLSVSKFTLYFHEVLSKYSTPHDMKIFCAKQNLDYVNLYVFFWHYSIIIFEIINIPTDYLVNLLYLPEFKLFSGKLMPVLYHWFLM